MNAERKDGFSMLGVGVAACAACCAGPIVAALGGLGLAGLVGAFVVGAAGFAVTASAAVAFVFVCRRRTGCDTPDEPVAVAAPSRRTPVT